QHRARTEGAGADQLAPAMVLDRAGEDLRRTRRALVGEHDDGDVECDAARIHGYLGALALGVLFDEDAAVLEELAGHGDGLVAEPTGVTADIEDQAADSLSDGRAECRAKLNVRLLAELVDGDVGHVGAGEAMPGDVVHLDLAARDVEGQLVTAALNAEV